MAVRKPIVVVSGALKELPAGDTIGAATITVSDSAPSTPATGDFWLTVTTGVLSIYTGSTWVEIAIQQTTYSVSGLLAQQLLGPL